MHGNTATIPIPVTTGNKGESLVGFYPHWRIPMTLGLALCGEDFILVAADKQETVELKHGGRHTQTIKKIERISDSCVFVNAGPNFGDALFKMVIEGMRFTCLLDPTPIIQLTAKLHEEYVKIPEERFPDGIRQSLQFLLAGIDSEKDPIAWIFTSEGFIPFVNPTFGIVGNQAQSQYLLSTFYKKQASVDELALLACFCIRETHKQDPLVGQEMDIKIVRRDKELESIPQERIEELSKRAEEISSQIKSGFHR